MKLRKVSYDDLSHCTLAEKYYGKNNDLDFKQSELGYLVPHGEFLSWVMENMKNVISPGSWSSNGEYLFPSLSAALKVHLSQYKLLVGDFPNNG